MKESCAYPWSSGSDVLHRYTQHSDRLASSCASLVDIRAQSTLRVLDVGCGDGRQTESMVHRLGPFSKEITLVEPDRRLLDCARLRLTARFPNLDVLSVADKVETLDARRVGRHDLVLSCHSAYYFEPLEDTVMSLVQLLSDKGKLVFIVRSVACDSFRVRELFAVHSQEQRPRDLFSLLPTIMEKCGMRVKYTQVSSMLALKHQSVHSPLGFSEEKLLAILKLWGHDQNVRTFDDLPSEVRFFCEEKSDQDSIKFSLVDEIIVGSR